MANFHGVPFSKKGSLPALRANEFGSQEGLRQAKVRVLRETIVLP
jgi:hypothetical protein